MDGSALPHGRGGSADDMAAVGEPGWSGNRIRAPILPGAQPAAGNDEWIRLR